MGKIIDRVRQRQQQAEKNEARRLFGRYEGSDGFICRWGHDGCVEVLHDLVLREPARKITPWWKAIW